MSYVQRNHFIYTMAYYYRYQRSLYDFLALSEYTKTKNKAKAKNELSRCDLSELETFDNDVKRVIKEILKEDEPKKTVQKVMYKKPVSVKQMR